MLSDYILKIHNREIKNPLKKLNEEEEKRFGKIGSRSYKTKKKIIKFIIESSNKNGALTNHNYKKIGDILNMDKTTVGLHIREMERNGVLKCIRVSKQQPPLISVITK